MCIIIGCETEKKTKRRFYDSENMVESDFVSEKNIKKHNILTLSKKYKNV